MKTSLSHDISRSELLTMREMGMTNAEIARSLDTTPATIIRYIGLQPAGLRKKRKHSK